MSARPNILFIITDQQRADTIHALGAQWMQTPALDSLAKEATIFAHCVTPSPVCVPARFSLYSGLYPAHSGCCNNNTSTHYGGSGFYSRFTEAGYDTCCVGKMHYASDLYAPLGFSKRYTQEELSDPKDDYTRFILSSPYRNVFDYNGMRSEMYYMPQISQLPAEYHPTHWVGDRSIEFLEHHDSRQPFFLVSSFIHPHPPFCPPAPWNKLYRSVSPEPYMPKDPGEFEPFRSDRFTREKLGISRQDLTLLRNFYYACISFVDCQIGRIFATLKKKGLWENTVIVFTSDHGEMLGDFGTMGKRSMLDGAVRIPLLVRLPGRGPSRRDDVCSLVDLPPTLLEACGIGYDASLFDGIDLFGGKRHETVFSQYSTGNTGTYMISGETDKLVYFRALDAFYYFPTSPEDTNHYTEGSGRIRFLREKLETYMSEDCCVSGGDSAPGERPKKLPYGPKRMDHTMRHDEEAARIPSPYTIDL